MTRFSTLLAALLWLSSTNVALASYNIDPSERPSPWQQHLLSDPQLALTLIEQAQPQDWPLHRQFSRFDSKFVIALMIDDLDLAAQAVEQMRQLLQQQESAPAGYQQWLSLLDIRLTLSRYLLAEGSAAMEQLAPPNRDSLPGFNVWYYLVRATIAQRNNAYEDALKDYALVREALAVTPSPMIDIVLASQSVQIAYFQTDYQQALTNSQTLEALARQHQNDHYLVVSYVFQMNMYNVMLDLALATVEEGRDDGDDASADQAQSEADEYDAKALHYQQAAIALASKIGYHRQLIRALVGAQGRYLREEKYQQTVDTALKAIEVSTEQQFHFEAGVSYNNLALAYFSLEQLEQAVDSLHQAEALYKKIGSQQSLLWVKEDFAKGYEQLGYYQEALGYYKAFHQASLELLSKTNSEQVMQLQEQFAAEQKQREIERLNQTNRLKDIELEKNDLQTTLLVGGGAILILIIWGLYSRSLRTRKHNQRLKMLNDKLNQLSMTDQLTGLHNRHWLKQLTLNNTTTQPGRAIALIDIDDFKAINDTYGHDVGDQTLKQVARDLLSGVRANDEVVRWGGEEFLLILNGVNQDDVSHTLTRIINHRNDSHVDEGSSRFVVTLSAGFVHQQGDCAKLSIEQTIKVADKLLYRAKHHGKNRAIGINSEQLQTGSTANAATAAQLDIDSDALDDLDSLQLLPH